MNSGIKRHLLQRLLPPPVRARHMEYSLVISVDDDSSQPSARLLDVALRSAAAAREIKLDDIAARAQETPAWPAIWPGEHYRLLAGLVEFLDPKLVVEIGTYTGMSALALKHRLAADGQIVTFDVQPWRTFSHTLLNPRDFSNGRLDQVVDDLSTAEGFSRHRSLLTRADLIFVDAAKDGLMEARLLRGFESTDFATEPIIVFDDIRLWNMLAVWRGISRPKLDLTSLGHWSGTGLVDWIR
jgi:predicted O-methyltransferase YrrM